MSLSLVPPRHVVIGDAASFVGTTPKAICSYHDIGLLPEPDRGSDGEGRYGYEAMIRLLWVQKMVDGGIALGDIRDVFADPAPAGADSGQGAAVVQRLRTVEGRMGLFSTFVSGRLEDLPECFLRQADLDALLVMERIFGPFGAALNVGRYFALAAHSGLREESDRVDAAEEALDDTVSIVDPRVAQVAAERHAFERRLVAAMEESGQPQSDEAILDSWDALHPAVPGNEGEACHVGGGEDQRTSLSEVIGLMPYDYSPARLRSMELTAELDAAGVAYTEGGSIPTPKEAAVFHGCKEMFANKPMQGMTCPGP